MLPSPPPLCPENPPHKGTRALGRAPGRGGEGEGESRPGLSWSQRQRSLGLDLSARASTPRGTGPQGEPAAQSGTCWGVACAAIRAHGDPRLLCPRSGSLCPGVEFWKTAAASGSAGTLAAGGADCVRPPSLAQSRAPVPAREGPRRHAALTVVPVNTSSCLATYFNRLGKIGILSGRRRLSSLPAFTLHSRHLGDLSFRWDVNPPLLRDSLSTRAPRSLSSQCSATLPPAQPRGAVPHVHARQRGTRG